MVFVFQKYIHAQPKPEQAKETKLQGKYIVDPSQLMAGLDHPKINRDVMNDIGSFFDRNNLNKGKDKSDVVVPFTKGEIREKIVNMILDRAKYDEESKKSFTSETGYPPALKGVQDYYDYVIFNVMIKPALTPIVTSK